MTILVVIILLMNNTIYTGANPRLLFGNNSSFTLKDMRVRVPLERCNGRFGEVYQKTQQYHNNENSQIELIGEIKDAIENNTIKTTFDRINRQGQVRSIDVERLTTEQIEDFRSFLIKRLVFLSDENLFFKEPTLLFIISALRHIGGIRKSDVKVVSNFIKLSLQKERFFLATSMTDLLVGFDIKSLIDDLGILLLRQASERNNSSDPEWNIDGKYTITLVNLGHMGEIKLIEVLQRLVADYSLSGYSYKILCEVYKRENFIEDLRRPQIDETKIYKKLEEFLSLENNPEDILQAIINYENIVRFVYHGTKIGLVRDAIFRRQGLHGGLHNDVSTSINTATFWSEMRVDNAFMSDDDNRPTLSHEEILKLMSDEEKNKADAMNSIVLEFDAVPLVWKYTKLQSEIPVGIIDLNYLSQAYKWELIKKFKIKKALSWMNKDWGQLIEYEQILMKNELPWTEEVWIKSLNKNMYLQMGQSI